MQNPKAGEVHPKTAIARESVALCGLDNPLPIGI